MNKEFTIDEIRQLFPILANPVDDNKELLEKLDEPYTFANKLYDLINGDIESICCERLHKFLKELPGRRICVSKTVIDEINDGDYNNALCIVTAYLKHEHAEDLYVTAFKLDDNERLVFEGYGYYTQEQYNDICVSVCEIPSYYQLLKTALEFVSGQLPIS